MICISLINVQVNVKLLKKLMKSISKEQNYKYNYTDKIDREAIVDIVLERAIISY